MKQRSAVRRERGAYAAPTEIGIDGCFLAGAWTDTGWPATMEGAVRSGKAAASSALSHLSLAPIGATTRTQEVFA